VSKPTTPGWVIRLTAYFVLLLPAAFLTGVIAPSTDAISLLVWWPPCWLVLVGLFELGYFLYRRRP
jgi:hypothetical protein